MLFDPISLRGLTVRNRVWLPPMCQYALDRPDGVPTDWHLVHYGARAAQGFGLMIIEATAVLPEGRITQADLGLWNDQQTAGFEPLVDFSHRQKTAVAVQLAHAGRKGSTWPDRPDAPSGLQSVADGGFTVVGPSAEAFPGLAVPHALTLAEVQQIPLAFAAAAKRADQAKIDVVELHAAHGYLLHQFLSPLSNHRTDAYGGDFAGRSRLLREVVTAVRQVWPEQKPLFVRLSATDWVEGGWTLAQTVELSQGLKELGVDLIDVSTGGNVPASIPVGPGYQVRFAAEVKRQVGLPVSAVGLITDANQAEQILRSGQADVVMIGRAGLRDPGWPEMAAAVLGAPTPLAPAYLRAALPRG
ncbi:MAG: NADH:flavin oxidoreductase/NADH oxidase [Propionibacteriaceae bacterium]|jgi:2,4-dienoyl-CoA reductase-like NADH-dependent reductase (Old Yellow Enzyme family)|nr:NADH:flavin oxidoreductase/NADH oxidase [Propionibacteriaceae bacterium]